ncbi:hypothetical protein [Ancylobacter sp.]|uniref:hypothetical protein n=1 Tax=Ancylobacter sp. TaxID=1872567 RepID=UPI003C7D50A0
MDPEPKQSFLDIRRHGKLGSGRDGPDCAARIGAAAAAQALAEQKRLRTERVAFDADQKRQILGGNRRPPLTGDARALDVPGRKQRHADSRAQQLARAFGQNAAMRWLQNTSPSRAQRSLHLNQRARARMAEAYALEPSAYQTARRF